jgi:hypothetical protein
MSDACNAITSLVAFGDFGSQCDDCAGEVASDCSAFHGEERVVDMLPGDFVSWNAAVRFMIISHTSLWG